MDYSLIIKTSAITICIILFAGMILFFVAGRLVRTKWSLSETETKGGVAMVQSALLGLFAFILAFAFSLSGNRYDYVRTVMIDESNAIGTAVLRTDLYADSVRRAMRHEFKIYIDARISMYKNLHDTSSIKNAIRNAGVAGMHIWDLAVSESRKPNMLIPSNQMIPALNEMLDIGSKRHLLLQTSIPDIIVYMLLILALASSFLAGVTSLRVDGRDKLIILFFIFFSSIVIFITLDMGRPLRGAIRADVAEQAILHVRQQLDAE